MLDRWFVLWCLVVVVTLDYYLLDGFVNGYICLGLICFGDAFVDLLVFIVVGFGLFWVVVWVGLVVRLLLLALIVGLVAEFAGGLFVICFVWYWFVYYVFCYLFGFALWCIVRLNILDYCDAWVMIVLCSVFFMVNTSGWLDCCNSVVANYYFLLVWFSFRLIWVGLCLCVGFIVGWFGRCVWFCLCFVK